jgi:hypothetical protein
MPGLENVFEFKQCVYILKATGLKARTLSEMRECISTISDESIFHHTYQYFLKGHILEYTNDFAQWAGESIEESALAEHLSSIDIYEFTSINDLRKNILDVIDKYLADFPMPRDAMPENEFYFNETKTLIFSAGTKVQNLAEFLIAVKYIDSSSLYYHFYEARVRLGGGVDDFSAWIEHILGKNEVAVKIRSIDPFIHTIEGIREHLVEIVEAEVKLDMEGIV